jgi:hypothetical protein
MWGILLMVWRPGLSAPLDSHGDDQPLPERYPVISAERFATPAPTSTTVTW